MSVDQGGDDRSILIDLDVLPFDPGPQRPRSRGRRWLLVTVVLILVAGLLTGAERRRDLAPVFQLSGEAQQAQISDGVLFVSPQMRSIVRAYSMPQGRLLWSRQSAVEDGRSEWRAYGDVLVLAVRNTSGGLKNLEALDGWTGRSLWRVDRAALVGGVGNTLVIGRLLADDTVPGSGAGSGSVAVPGSGAGSGGAAVPGSGAGSGGAAASAGAGADGSARAAGALVGLDRRTGAELWSQPLSIVDLATVVGDTATDGDTPLAAEVSAASGSGSSAASGSGSSAASGSGSSAASGSGSSAASGSGSSAALRAVAPAAPRNGAGYAVVTGADGSARAYDAHSGRPVSDAEVVTGLTDGRLLDDIGEGGGFVGLGTCTVLLYGAVASQRWRRGACVPESVLRRVAEKALPGQYSEVTAFGSTIVSDRGRSLMLLGETSDADDLHGWARVGSVAGGRRLVVARTEGAGRDGRTVFAQLDSTGRTPTVLGLESRAIGKPTCHGDDRYVVCRGVLGLGVWRLPHARS